MTIKLGYNVPGQVYYTQAQMYNNSIRQSLASVWSVAPGADGAYQDSNMFFTSLPIAADFNHYVWTGNASPRWNRFRSGKWSVLYSGNVDISIYSCTHLAVSGAGLGAQSPPTGYAKRFTVQHDDSMTPSVVNGEIAVPPGGDVTTVVLRITNNSGTLGTLTKLAFVHEDDEADFLAGNLLTQGFRDFHRTSKGLRFLDQLPTNGVVGGTTDAAYSDYPKDTWMGYGQFIPAKIMGVIPIEMPNITNLHIPIPLHWLSENVADNLTCAYQYLADLATVLPATGVTLGIEAGNEVWGGVGNGQMDFCHNFAINNSLVIRDGTGAITADTSWAWCAGEGHMSARAWRIAESIFPRATIIRVLEHQPGSQRNQTAAKAIGRYVDPVSGTAVRLLVDESGAATYCVPYSDNSGIAQDAYGNGTDFTYQSMVEQKAWLKSDSWWSELFQNYLDNSLIPNFAGDIAQLAIESPQAKQRYYEGGLATYGQSYDDLAAGLTHKYYLVPHPADESVSLSAAFGVYCNGHGNISLMADDNDQLSLVYNGPSLGTTKRFLAAASGCTDDSHFYPFVKNVSGGRLRLFADQADYDNDNYILTSTATAVYGGDSNYAVRGATNLTRDIQIQTRIKGFLNDGVGTALFAYLYRNLLALGQLEWFFHYGDCFNWDDSSAAQWAVAVGYHEPSASAMQKIIVNGNYKRSSNTADLSGPFV